MRNYTDVAFALGLCGGIFIAIAVMFVCLRHISKLVAYYEDIINVKSKQIAELTQTVEHLQGDKARQKNLMKTGSLITNTAPQQKKPWTLDIAYCGPRGYIG